MILKKIKLQNIRSYLSQEIEFPEDLILLSGNVGSGKSSILLAIDFALFGIRRGELSGSALLRNGEDNGKVNLVFEVEGNEIEIERTLKRKQDTVVQDSGYIIINGTRKDGTAVELKQSILELLNYPSELLTKSKSLIYRYTVYTPQEEMKQILLGDKDFRVDSLRKVFGVDKYKRIKENCLIFGRYLKEETKEMRGILINYDDKLKLLEEKKKLFEDVKLNLSRINVKIEEHTKEVYRVKEKIKKIEDEGARLQELRHKLELLDVKVSNENDKLKHNEIEINEIKKQIMQLRLDLGNEVKVDEREIEKIKLETENDKRKLKDVENKISEFKINVSNSENLRNSIQKMNICPTCKRGVSEEDKLKIRKEEYDKITDFMSKMKFNEPAVLELNNKISENEKEIERLRELKASSEAVKLKIGNLDEKNNLLKKLEDEINVSKNVISNSEADKKLVLDEIEKLGDVEKEYRSFKELFDKLLERDKEFSLEKNGFEKDVSNLNEEILNLSSEIKEQDKVKGKLNSYEKLLGWLNEHFVNLMSIIERKIMLRVHNDFNSMFKKWFEMLIDDELISVKLDEEFTPLIEQNGHSIDYEHLSGGEKTAAALAYRLALNQVINHLISVIKTKDLLILDEPTDGFSNEQIERIKDVLLELDNKQTIIVSHESKIESFVNCIIKLGKEGHVSSVQN